MLDRVSPSVLRTTSAIAAILALSCQPSAPARRSARRAPRSRVEAGETGAAHVRRHLLERVGIAASRIDDDGRARLVRALGRHAAAPGLTPVQAARGHLTAVGPALGLPGPALEVLDPVRTAARRTEGGSLVVFRQRVAGVEVLGSELRVLLRADGSLVAMSGDPSPWARPASRPPRFRHDEREAVDAAARDAPSTRGATAVVPGRVRPALVPDGGRLIPVWVVEIAIEADRAHELERVIVAADDLRIVERRSLTARDAFRYRVWADAEGDLRPADGPLTDFSPHPTGMPDGTSPEGATAVLLAVEGLNSPEGGAPDPWLRDGALESSGNNVNAYTDSVPPDGFSDGDLHATATGAGELDRTYDLSAGPLATDDQRRAAVTQAFYTANWLHDWWYDSGFDEAAGNAQTWNFGRGGVEGDAMLVEIENGAPDEVNSSSMSTPADGAPPTMQLYLWSGSDEQRVHVEPPGEDLPTITADFGPAEFDVTASLVRLLDGEGASSMDGCEPAANDVTGQIALIDRGTCSFELKAAGAEAAGAVGVLIANNLANAGPMSMGDDVAELLVSIPVMSVSLENGVRLDEHLAEGPVTATLRRAVALRDGALDNTITAHEWGHFLHHRLAQCFGVQCGAMSEGWGDFVALHMMVREGDDLAGAFAIGAYSGLLSTDPAYFGIRRAPMSIEPGRNALSFRHITSDEPLPEGTPLAVTMGGNAEPHNAGEIWASMLWEAYAALLAETSLPEAPRTFAQTQRRMSDLVVEALLMTPPEATYTEARDALLVVAGADQPTIAAAFARRGAGSCAISAPRDSVDFAGVVESFEVAPWIAAGSVTLDDALESCDHDGVLEAGERGRITVGIANAGPAPLADATLTAATEVSGVGFPAGAVTPVPAIEPFGATTATLEIELDETFADGVLPVALTIESAAACRSTVALELSPIVNRVESGPVTNDSFEAPTTPWTASAPSDWARARLGDENHVFQGADHPFPSETFLESPDLEVSETDPLVITFRHAYDFESGYDGGVVDVSADAGATWQPAESYAEIPYDLRLGGGTGNPIDGRRAFSGLNPAWPDLELVTLDFGTAFAGQTVRLRFRVGSDLAIGGQGWLLDDFSVMGITNAPFRDAAIGSSCAPPADAGTPDSGSPDAAPPDAGPSDAGPPDAAAERGGPAGGGLGCRAVASSAHHPLPALGLIALVVHATSRTRRRHGGGLSPEARRSRRRRP